MMNLKPHLKALATILLSWTLGGFGHLLHGYNKRGAIFLGLTLANMLIFLFAPPLFYTFNLSAFKYFYATLLLLLFIFLLYLLWDSLKVSYSPKTPHKRLPKKFYQRYLVLFVLAALFSTGFNLLLPDKSVYHYTMPSDAMAPTLLKGDQIVAVEVAGTYLSQLRNRLITYNSPPENSSSHEYQIHVGRAVAVEGDKIRIDKSSGDIFVNGATIKIPNRGNAHFDELKASFYNESKGDLFLDKFWNGEELIIPESKVFILRDTYQGFMDSRSFGLIDSYRIGELVDFVIYSRDALNIRWDRILKSLQ